MAVNFAHYTGREQAFVKHTFLDKYLPSLIGKVCAPKSRYREFVYVDGFAGPWKSNAGESFEDTSFGLALKHMTEQRRFYLAKGHDVQMRAFLVEKDANSFVQLQSATKKFADIDVVPLNGLMEDHAASIASSIGSTAFSFTLIDPKGFPQIGKLSPLLERRHAEALVNFMFDFANRFAATDLIPALESWLSALGSNDWKREVVGLSGVDRERKLEKLASGALQFVGQYDFAPSITVDKVLHDRALYKLIFLSRQREGLAVFRDCEFKALEAQAEARSATKAKRRSEDSAVGDFFADGSDAIPNDRSSQLIRLNQKLASEQLEQRLSASGTVLIWEALWPDILAEFSVTRSWLGRQVNAYRKSGQLTAPGWPSERKQIPNDKQRLIWT